jgi:CBS-domain-containing membrane protein
MSRRDTYIESLYRHLGSAYYQILRGQGTAADVARAVRSVAEADHGSRPPELSAYKDLVARLAADPSRSRRTWHRLQVRDVMTTDVAAVDLAASYKQVARVLAERSVTAVPVLDQAGRVLGVASEADMLCKQERGHAAPAGSTRLRTRSDRAKAAAHTAAELMTSPPFTIDPDAYLGSAARLMNDRRVKRLPVVDSSGTLIGIVSRRDLLSVFVRPDVDIAVDVHAIIVGILLEDSSDVSVSVSEGVVTLAGALSQPGHAAAAIRLASEVDGVVDVIDNLKRLKTVISGARGSS